jgi:hypothetical protein
MVRLEYRYKYYRAIPTARVKKKEVRQKAGSTSQSSLGRKLVDIICVCSRRAVKLASSAATLLLLLASTWFD